MKLLSIVMGMVLFGSWGFSANAQELMTLKNCREMALENNKGLQMAEMDNEVARLQKESAKKHFFPQLSSEAGFMRRNKQYQLFGEDMFLPVIPFEGIDSESGSFDPSILRDPDLAPEVIVTNPVTGEPVLDAEGNPVFRNYAWLPREEGKLGQKNNYQLGLTLKQPVYMGGKSGQATGCLLQGNGSLLPGTGSQRLRCWSGQTNFSGKLSIFRRASN